MNEPVERSYEAVTEGAAVYRTAERAQIIYITLSSAHAPAACDGIREIWYRSVPNTTHSSTRVLFALLGTPTWKSRLPATWIA